MKKPVMRQRPYAVNARLVLWDRRLRIAYNDAKEHVPPTHREVTILGAGMVLLLGVGIILGSTVPFVGGFLMVVSVVMLAAMARFLSRYN